MGLRQTRLLDDIAVPVCLGWRYLGSSNVDAFLHVHVWRLLILHIVGADGGGNEGYREDMDGILEPHTYL